MKTRPNKLINEKSPYLLQHAYNPVEWNPWGEEAFSRAREESKPIFLSIGYSTCYWCHVMEREVFENESIAEKMNQLFVNIKVDREERPDIDRVYMTALQSMTGSGGWPMSMFLTPDLKPFYGATYIPPKAKYGRAGFEDVIEQISEVWKTKNADVIKSGEQIVSLLQNNLTRILTEDDIIIPSSLTEKAFEQCRTAYDFENGGFGQGNKFPRPVTLNFLMYYYYFNGESEALDMVTYTLRKMYKGGMYDHLGGGFHRYSVDYVWRVPHFEKMLYDQAQLIETYLDAYLITKDDLFKSVAADTINYAMNNLYSDEGGFYSAEDAESAIDISSPDEKSEGEFYLWTKDVLDKLLGAEDSRIFSYFYGIEFKGNTISDPHNVFTDKNVLYIANDEFECAKHFSKTAEEIIEIINRCKNILIDVRGKRPRPHLDDKVLTSWNGLMVSALAKAYNVTKDEHYIVTARKTIEFIKIHLYDEVNESLFHRYRDGDVRFEATLEDYSYLIKGLIDLYESTLDADYAEFAMILNRKTIDNFYDNENGGFFDVGSSASDVILTTKETYDGAEPSGNSVQISNLIRLGHLSGDTSMLDRAEKSLKLFYEETNKLPFSSPQLLCSYFLYLRGVKEIIIKPGADAGEMNTFGDLLSGSFLPDKVLSSVNDKTLKLFPHIKEIILGNSSGSAQVFLCENFKCSLPVSDVESLNKLLKKK